ncbi:extracellular solute-binding protein [Brachybacterium sp. J144]|uniref:ABC transporter substrate-binding protein n=1 Tax=Brachybacterium sp. J144 TaxID=3116487 RepID=UPI002E770DF2|nr:extracellular solute-binding protein [Brachybacterium sp. J144]MEE1651837.1 extracellular solute-binding protein [Brachybacterium sp. J144]
MSLRTPAARPTRRSLLTAGALGAVGALSAGGLAGCSSSGRPKVTFHQAKREVVPHFRELVSAYNSEQSAFTYVHDMATNLQAGFVRSSPPDLALLNYNLEMARFMERGALSDLSDLPEAGMIRAVVLDLVDWYPGYEDRTSVIPYSVAAASVIYNKRLFEEHGVEVPTTWDELIAACETFLGAGVTPIYGTFPDLWTLSQGLFDYTIGGLVDVRDFFTRLGELGEEVGPDSEVSFQGTLLEPVRQMLELLPFHNEDAASRTYGDGNTAFAQGRAAMYLQGPWALVEIEKGETDIELGSFPLPVTDDPDDRMIRVNVDLSLWVPEQADQPEGARAFLQHLMLPEIQHPYNELALAFNTTEDGPAVTDPRIAEMQPYYDDGRFYMGASQFIPPTIPFGNYLQEMVLGADPEPILAQVDAEWSRLAYRA